MKIRSLLIITLIQFLSFAQSSIDVKIKVNSVKNNDTNN